MLTHDKFMLCVVCTCMCMHVCCVYMCVCYAGVHVCAYVSLFVYIPCKCVHVFMHVVLHVCMCTLYVCI